MARSERLHYGATMGAARDTSITAQPVDSHVRSSNGMSRHLGIVIALARADLVDRYGRGAGRFVRWLLDPLMLLGVYLLLVVYVLDQPGDATGLSLACAVVPYQLMMATVTNCLDAVHARESIILNMTFERSLVPPAAVLMETAGFVASLSLIVFMMVVYGVGVTAAIVWFPALFVVTVVLALGVAYPATLFGIWFRQSRNLAIGFTRALFFLAPGLVPLSEASPTAQRLLELNPLTGLFEAYRNVFLYGTAPSATDLLYPLLIAGVLLVLVVPLYRRDQGQFAKVVE